MNEEMLFVPNVWPAPGLQVDLFELARTYLKIV
jgi:hypothetical protein